MGSLYSNDAESINIRDSMWAGAWDVNISANYLESIRKVANLRASGVEGNRKVPLFDFDRDITQYKTPRRPSRPKPAARSGGRTFWSKSKATDAQSIRSTLPEDSIETKVTAFLAAPRLSCSIKHPTSKRKISYSQVGDLNGHPVFCCLGMGMTRYASVLYDELAATLGLRLITIERPGIGDSDPSSDDSGTPLNWPGDLLAICSEHKIRKFSLLAHSAGTIYALSTALKVPDMISGTIHLLAPWIPTSQMSPLGGFDLSMPTSPKLPPQQRVLRLVPTPFLKVADSMNLTGLKIRKSRSSVNVGQDRAPSRRSPYSPQSSNGRPSDSSSQTASSMDRSLSPTGTTATSITDMEDWRKAYDQHLVTQAWNLATKKGNASIDLIACLERRQRIGFQYTDVSSPVTIYQGDLDKIVPLQNVKLLSRLMQSAELRIIEGDGHLLMSNAAVMVGLFMKLMEEVTGY